MHTMKVFQIRMREPKATFYASEDKTTSIQMALELGYMLKDNYFVVLYDENGNDVNLDSSG